MHVFMVEHDAAEVCFVSGQSLCFWLILFCFWSRLQLKAFLILKTI